LVLPPQLSAQTDRGCNGGRKHQEDRRGPLRIKSNFCRQHAADSHGVPARASPCTGHTHQALARYRCKRRTSFTCKTANLGLVSRSWKKIMLLTVRATRQKTNVPIAARAQKRDTNKRKRGPRAPRKVSASSVVRGVAQLHIRTRRHYRGALIAQLEARPKASSPTPLLPHRRPPPRSSSRHPTRKLSTRGRIEG
jgi:hypothetical protein